jgi:hypothetical protein
MKSIYESAKSIMEKEGFLARKFRERDERIAKDTAAREKTTNPVPATSDAGAGQSSSKFAATDPRRLDKGDGGKAARVGAAASAERNQVKPTVKPQAAAVAKPAAAPTPAPTGSEASRPSIDTEKKDIISKAMSAKPETKAEPSSVIDDIETNNKEASATKPNDSGGMRGNFSTAKGSNDSNEPSKPSGSPMAGIKYNTAEKPQASMSAPASSERQDVKDSSGATVKDSSGSAVKTRSADEIGDTNPRTGKVTPGSFEKNQQQGQENLKKLKGMFGMKESINKKFDITDALYQSVMEVMKKGNIEGSVPRNEKEKDLAAHHGDPDVITHGDVLVARGVTPQKKTNSVNTMKKEEVETVDEMSSKMKMKLGLYGKKKKTNEETVEEGMGSAAKSMAKKILSKLGGGSDEDQRKDLQRKMGVPQTGKKPMKEGKDTPGNSYEHQCAIHVKSESYGEGRTITTQHASPDAEGNIAWYDVMFEHGIEKQVPTSTLEILVSEMHGHSKKKKM